MALAREPPRAICGATKSDRRCQTPSTPAQDIEKEQIMTNVFNSRRDIFFAVAFTVVAHVAAFSAALSYATV